MIEDLAPHVDAVHEHRDMHPQAVLIVQHIAAHARMPCETSFSAAATVSPDASTAPSGATLLK